MALKPAAKRPLLAAFVAASALASMLVRASLKATAASKTLNLKPALALSNKRPEFAKDKQG